MEQAEKILFLTAKEAQAAETPAFQQPVLHSDLAAAPPSSAAQVMMLLGLANVKDSLLPKRTASLARFLHKRKQRQAITIQLCKFMLLFSNFYIYIST
ncbi:hypothetical protein PVAP13_1KG498700 [Panicum virgatum]|uniref:Uncharacterized protein n=2 Tax=Panicum virgatum TaxID=38727 RepID=A0A8T0XIJ9_PANVG|nr:hypothetical protein PVAP13_1KG498700 [Panicum virgatum]